MIGNRCFDCRALAAFLGEPGMRTLWRTVGSFEGQGAKFEEDKTYQQVLRATNRKLASDGYKLEKSR
jgi:hypothetical protein